MADGVDRRERRAVLAPAQPVCDECREQAGRAAAGHGAAPPLLADAHRRARTEGTSFAGAGKARSRAPRHADPDHRPHRLHRWPPPCPLARPRPCAGACVAPRTARARRERALAAARLRRLAADLIACAEARGHRRRRQCRRHLPRGRRPDLRHRACARADRPLRSVRRCARETSRPGLGARRRRRRERAAFHLQQARGRRSACWRTAARRRWSRSRRWCSAARATSSPPVPLDGSDAGRCLPLPRRRRGSSVQPIHVDDLAEALAVARASETRTPTGRLGAGRRRGAACCGDYLQALRCGRSAWAPLRPMIALPRRLMGAAARAARRTASTAPPARQLERLGRCCSAATTAPVGRDGARCSAGRRGRPRPSWRQRRAPPACARAAQLDWLLPTLRLAISAVWIWTGIVSLGLYPKQESLALLARVGANGMLAEVLLYGAALLDIVLGVSDASCCGGGKCCGSRKLR